MLMPTSSVLKIKPSYYHIFLSTPNFIGFLSPPNFKCKHKPCPSEYILLL